MAQRLQAVVRPSDTVARLGGDVGCGSATTTGLAPAASTSPVTTTAATPTATAANPEANCAAANALTTWCSLELVERQVTVLAVMSGTNAQQTHDYDAICASLLTSFGYKNYSAVAWYASHSTLLATFNADGKTVNLQAYVKGTLTSASTELTCRAFR